MLLRKVNLKIHILPPNEEADLNFQPGYILPFDFFPIFETYNDKKRPAREHMA